MPKTRVKNDPEVTEENKAWFSSVIEKAPFNQREMAIRLGITEGSVSAWKKTGQISVNHIMRICEIAICEPPGWLRAQNKEKPSGQDRAKYQPLPKPLAEILDSYKAQDLSLDDLYSLLQISGRLAAKNQKISKLESTLEASEARSEGETKT
ncbi:MAG: hypothetical protein AB9Q19_12620 [Candidatus Reddybacter sp.]